MGDEDDSRTNQRTAGSTGLNESDIALLVQLADRLRENH